MTAARTSVKKPKGLWIAVGAAALALVGGITAALMTNRKSSITTAFRASEPAVPNAPIANNAASSSPASSSNTGLISGSVGPEITTANSPALKLAEEFAKVARQGNADLALRMIAHEDFEKRLKDGQTASWEAIMKSLDATKVFSHLRSKSLEGTPLDEGFRHWRVLGETVHDGQPAVLVRYYSDPEYPRQLIRNSDNMLDLTQVISMDEFKSHAKDLVLYNAKGRNRNAPPSIPDTHGFLPPRFGYLLLVLDTSGGDPKIVNIVSVLSQVPMSQMAGLIFLRDYQVIQIGSGSESEFKKRADKAKALGRKLFSTYGTVPDNREWTQIQTSVASAGDKGIPSPPLLFRPPENIGADFKAQSNKEISEWLAQNEPSRTTRLIKVAQALDQASSDAASFIAEFKKQYPGDPGADLAVISFAMTPLEPRMPDALLGVIDQSAESLFKTFNDPFMLFVRGLVHEAKGDQAGSDKFMQQSNQAGFVSVRMLREPFEQAVQRGDKEATLAALKQIGDYWSTKAELDKSSNAEGLFGQVWTTAKNKSDALKSQLAKRDGDSGGISNFNPGNNSQASPFGRALPQGLQAGLPRTGRDPNPMPNPTPDTMRREPGFAGPQRPGGQPGPGLPGGAPGGIPGGFPPPPEPSSANVRFVLDAKTKLDANAILEKLKDKLKVGNFQMSTSGNKSTITLGFAGPFDEAIKAVDFGKVTKTDQATRTINIELP